MRAVRTERVISSSMTENSTLRGSSPTTFETSSRDFAQRATRRASRVSIGIRREWFVRTAEPARSEDVILRSSSPQIDAVSCQSVRPAGEAREGRIQRGEWGGSSHRRQEGHRLIFGRYYSVTLCCPVPPRVSE